MAQLREPHGDWREEEGRGRGAACCVLAWLGDTLQVQRYLPHQTNSELGFMLFVALS